MAVDLIHDAVVARLLANVAVTAKVADRIVPSHISHLTDPVYPLLCISVLTPGDKLPKVPFSRFQLLMIAYSTLSYYQARDILDSAITELNDTVVRGTLTAWELEQATTPIDDIDPEPTVAYYSGVIFHVRQIG